MPTLGTNIAILAADRILLIQQADFGLWALPGGGVDAGESVAEAAIREAREETGLEVRLTRLVGVYSLPQWHQGGNHTILFTAEPVGGALLQGVTSEALDARYFASVALPDALVWWHRQRILDALQGVGGGNAWSQHAIWPFAPEITRQEIYRLREQGVTRQHSALWADHPGPEGEQLQVGEVQR